MGRALVVFACAVALGACAAPQVWTPTWPEAQATGLPLAGMVRVPAWLEIPTADAAARALIEESFRRAGARTEHLRWRDLGPEGLPGTRLVVHAETRPDGRRTEVGVLVRRASWEPSETDRVDLQAHRAWVLDWLHPQSGVARRIGWASSTAPPPELLALTVEHWTVRLEAVVDRWADGRSGETWTSASLEESAEALVQALERAGFKPPEEAHRFAWLDAWMTTGQAALSRALWPQPPRDDGSAAPLAPLPVPLLPATTLGVAVLATQSVLASDDGWEVVAGAEARATTFALRWREGGVVRPVDFLATASQIPHAAPVSAWVSGVRSVLPVGGPGE